MKYLLTLAALVFISSLMACSGLSAGQIESVREALTPLVVDGKMTQQQLETLIQALAGGGVDWEYLLSTAGEIGIAIAGAIFGINVRDKIRSRKTKVA